MKQRLDLPQNIFNFANLLFETVIYYILVFVKQIFNVDIILFRFKCYICEDYECHNDDENLRHCENALQVRSKIIDLYIFKLKFPLISVLEVSSERRAWDRAGH